MNVTKQSCYTIFLGQFFLLFSIASHAGSIGNNTAVSIQGLTTFPSGVFNEMLGFAAFTNGFTLTDVNTSCSFNAFFPVGGTIRLNGGNLFLNEDLTLTPSLVMATAGGFYGTQKTLILTTTRDLAWPVGGVASFGQLTSFDTGINVATVSWAFDNTYIGFGDMGGDDTLGVLQFANNALSLVASVTNATEVNTVRFHPSTYFLARGVNANGAVPGVQVWQFTPGTNNFVPTSGSDINNTIQTVEWHTSGNFLAVGNNISNGRLEMYPFNTTTGALGTPTITALPASADFFGTGCLSWDPGGTYLAVGLRNNAATELQIYLFNGTTLTFTLGAEIGTDVRGLSWSPTGSFIALGLGGGANRLQVYQHNVANGTLTNVVSVAEGTNVNSVDWTNDGNFLAMGKDSGGGTDVRVYSFNKTTPALTVVQQVDTSPAANIREVNWSPNNNYLATGDNNELVTIYQFSSGLNLGTSPFIFNNINIVMGSNIFFQSPVKFQGNCILNGQGNTIGCGDTGSIIIDSRCSLLCDQLTMTQVAGKITMVDATSSITLSNVTWILDANHSFTQGYLNFANTVHITATTLNTLKFTYQSSNQSLIKSYATLFMDNGITFSYDVPVASRNLFGMQDPTSVWYISGVTLHSTVTGMQLLKGTLRVDGTCSIESEATVPAQAIQFGDGITSDNDLTLELLAGSGLNVTSGFLSYNDVS